MIGDAHQAMPVLGSMWEQADGFVALKLVGIGLGVVGLVFFLGAAVAFHDIQIIEDSGVSL